MNRSARPLCLAALAAAAAALLYQLVRVWLGLPADNVGWIAPLFVPYFVWLRWPDRPALSSDPFPPLAWAGVILALAAVPVARLLLEPFPGWPLVEWVYAGALLGLMGVLLALWRGWRFAGHFAFPLGFWLAALPWPAVIQTGLFGRIRELLAEGVASVCNLLGEPAVAQGTVIRVANGLVGIEEACGGIRSMQLGLVVALAAGELRRESWPRRFQWIGASVLLSLVANALRLLVLTWVYARQGVAAFELWHDRAAWIELGVLLGGQALLFVFLRPRPAAAQSPLVAAPRSPVPALAAPMLAGALLGVVLLTEAGTWLWFRPGESATGALRPAPWTARLPAAAPDFATDPFTSDTQATLGCQSHEIAHWTDGVGHRRAGYVLEWNRGQNARFALLDHNPESCLPWAGAEPVGPRTRVAIRIGGVALPFVRTAFRSGNEVFYIYYLAWDLTRGEPFALFGERPPDTGAGWFSIQWQEVAAHRRSIDVRAIAVAIFDVPDSAAADAAFLAEATAIVSPDA